MLVNLLEETAVEIDRASLIEALYQAAQALELHEADRVTIQLSASHSIDIDLVSSSFAVDYNT